jgi:cytochrome bd ubiquinol oxidase subunit II
MTALLAILFTGYFVLAGLDYGVAFVAAGRRDLDRIAPFFLGNEVWLVAAVGLLFGTFPANEGELLGAYRLPAGFALVGVIAVTASFGLRIFAAHPATGAGAGSDNPAGGTGALDGVAKVGGVVAAVGWGATLAAIAQGGEFRITPLVIAGAFGMPAVIGVHGWAFLRRRWAVLFATTAVLIGSVALVGSTIGWRPASSAALDLLQPIAYVLVPLLIVIQAATWWMFRTRHLSEAPTAALVGSD